MVSPIGGYSFGKTLSAKTFKEIYLQEDYHLNQCGNRFERIDVPDSIQNTVTATADAAQDKPVSQDVLERSSLLAPTSGLKIIKFFGEVTMHSLSMESVISSPVSFMSHA